MSALAITVLLWLSLAFFRLALLCALLTLLPLALVVGLVEYAHDR